MISAIASTTFTVCSPFVGSSRPAGPQPREGLRLALPLERSRGWRESEGLAAELLGDEVPAERGVVRGAMDVAVTALDRVRVQDRPRATALEQSVHRANAQPGNEGLV